MTAITLNNKKKSKHSGKYLALIDDEDFPKVNQYSWRVSITGTNLYAVATINGKSTAMHTLITGYKQTDHKDRNGLNNQKINLRESTTQQNLCNRVFSKGTSKYKGVSWCNHYSKWKAQICYNYKRYSLGYFIGEKEAALAYNKKAKDLFGEFAYLNKI